MFISEQASIFLIINKLNLQTNQLKMLTKMMIALAPCALAGGNNVQKILLTPEKLLELQSTDVGLHLDYGETVRLQLPNESCCDDDWEIPS